MTKRGKRRLVIFLCAAAVILVAAGIVRAKLYPPCSLHEQIADYMYHSRTDPKLEYLIEKYGDEFVATEYGSIQSTRFPGLQVHLEWSEQDQTYKDTYIVYIRQAELEDLLSTALNDIYSQYKIYILPYGLCPNDYNENTTAIELLKCSDTALPLVQLWIYTTDEVNDRDISCEMLQRKMQELGYFLYVNVRYVSPENFARIGAENFRGDEALKKEFYRCISSFYISPDSFEWSITDGWLEGLG